MISILFVCQANTCRSVALQGFLQNLITTKSLQGKYYVDSCGLTPSTAGCVDRLTQAAAAQRGIFLKHTPRPFKIEDFLIFDYIVPVSKDLLKYLETLSSEIESRKKLYLATSFSRKYAGQDIKDPYMHGGVEAMLDIIQEVTASLLCYLENKG